MNKTKTWRVTFDITLNSGHPRKWVPDAIYPSLEPGEDIDNWQFEEVKTAGLYEV